MAWYGLPWFFWFWPGRGRGICWWFLPWFLTTLYPYLGLYPYPRYTSTLEKEALEFYKESIKSELEIIKRRLEELERMKER